MEPSKAPEGAMRITFEFWTFAPYSASEREGLTSEFISWAAEGDDDIIEDGFDVRFESLDGIADKSHAEIAALLEKAAVGAQVTIRVNNESEPLVYKIGDSE